MEFHERCDTRWQFAAGAFPEAQPFTRVRLLRIFNVAGMFPVLSSYRIIVKALCEGEHRVTKG